MGSVPEGAIGGGVGGLLGLLLAVATWRHRLETIEADTRSHRTDIVSLKIESRATRLDLALIKDHLGIKHKATVESDPPRLPEKT